MKRFVKIFAICAVLVLAIATTVSFAGCQKYDVYVATNAAFPPFESVNAKGEYVGFDMALIDEIAKEAGFTYKIDNMEFDAVVGKIQSREDYIGIAGLTDNASRREHINFSKSYYNSYQVAVVKADNTAFDSCTTQAEVEALFAKQTIYAANGQVGYFYVDGDEALEFPKQVCKELKGLPTINECVEKLGVSDIAIADVTVAKEVVAKKSGYKVIDIPLTEEEYAIGVNKNNKELLDKINAAIDKLVANGKMDELKIKWLGGSAD